MNASSVAFLCNEYPPDMQGGIGTFTQMTARTLVKLGWSVRVLGYASRSYDGPQVQDDQGVEVHRLRRPSPDFLDLRALGLLYRTVRRWAAAGEIDLVELPDAEGWAALWPRLPIPVVSRVHGSSTYFALELGRLPHRGNYWRERLSLRRSDFWTGVSEYSVRKTQSIFKLRAPGPISYCPVTLPEAVDPLTRSRTTVVYTGTLTPKKGIQQLIKAWPDVVHRIPDARLHVYGKDTKSTRPSMTEAMTAALDPEIRHTVEFLGHRNRAEVLGALRSAAVAVFPSYAEAFAFAPIEAMACGCPTIYSTRTSGPELITHGRDGLLVDPDRPRDLADGIVTVLAEHAPAIRMGDRARERVASNFTVDRLVPLIAVYYRDCIRDFERRRFGQRSALRHRKVHLD